MRNLVCWIYICILNIFADFSNPNNNLCKLSSSSATIKVSWLYLYFKVANSVSSARYIMILNSTGLKLSNCLVPVVTGVFFVKLFSVLMYVWLPVFNPLMTATIFGCLLLLCRSFMIALCQRLYVKSTKHIVVLNSIFSAIWRSVKMVDLLVLISVALGLIQFN